MMRLMLSIAELVCSVANARCPVSAIVSAAAMVSRSRISPTSTTSGSCRSAYLSAAAKLLVRSEEHTSELQSRLHLVCRLLLEKKNTTERLDTRSKALRGSVAGPTSKLPAPPVPHRDTRWPACGPIHGGCDSPETSRR